ncbi:MAG: hypothetical protein ACI95C_000451 [Pseudohongiellaceae bacterium]|jgi:hypothetical protein
MKQLKPEISAWYTNSSNGDIFEVIAIDEETDSIEYQLIDGELGEFDTATWDSIKLKHAQQPIDWNADFDAQSDTNSLADADLESDDYSATLVDYDHDLPDFDDDTDLV